MERRGNCEQREREKGESKIWSEDRDGQRGKRECVINHPM